MQPLAARGLGETLQAEVLERVTDFERGGGNLRPGQADIRVEIKGDPVGLLDIVDGRAPGVDFEHADLDQRDQPGQILDR